MRLACRGTRFSAPCWYQSLSCVDSHRVTAVTISRSHHNLWPFCWRNHGQYRFLGYEINPSNAELNPICHLLALLGVHQFLHVSTIRVKSLTLRLLMSYIYMEHLFLMFLNHTQRRTTVGRTPLDVWSARRRDLYLTTNDTHNRQISMPPVGFEPKISALVQRSPTDCGASLCVI